MQHGEEKVTRRGDPALLAVARYQPNDGTGSMAEKLVHFLLFARGAASGVYFHANMVAKAIHRLGRLPSFESPETETVRGAVSRARQICLEKHGCSIYQEKGLGMRCTTDSDDQARTRVESAARRFHGAERALAAEASVVDPSKIKDESRRRWFKSEVVGMLRLVEQDKRLDRLLPPKKG